jgi:predicted ABC-type ATPase
MDARERFTMKPGELTVVVEPVDKANPYRDGASGRFTTGGGGAGAGSGSRVAPSTKPREGMGDIPLSEGAVAEMQGGSAAPHIVKDANGNYMFTPERQALHDKIVAESVDGVPSSDDPTFTVMGGGPAAGKSSLIQSGEFEIAPNSVEVNADLCKEKLPEWETAGSSRAQFTHEESSYLAKRTQAAAIERQQNVLLDGTGDTSPASMNKKIDGARSAGYKVEAHYVTLPTDLAIKNARERGERTGRFVPDEVVRATHVGVSQTFPAIVHKFDSVKLYDTSERGNTRLILSGVAGNIDIIDPKAYNEFLAKGNE